MRTEFIEQSFIRLYRSRMTPEKAAKKMFGSLVLDNIADYEARARREFARDLYEVLKRVHDRRSLKYSRGLTSRVLGRFWFQFLKNRGTSNAVSKQVSDIMGELWVPAVQDDDGVVLESILAGPQAPMAKAGIVRAIVRAEALNCAEVMSRRWSLPICLEDVIDLDTAAELTVSVQSARVVQYLLRSQRNAAWDAYFDRLSSSPRKSRHFGVQAIEVLLDTEDDFSRLVEATILHEVNLRYLLRAYCTVRPVMTASEAVKTVCRMVPGMKAMLPSKV